MGNNKAYDVNDFLEGVQNNKSTEKVNIQSSEKKSETVPTEAKCIKIDKDTYRRLQYLKTEYKFNHQDIILLATHEFLDKYFPLGEEHPITVSNKIRAKISQLNK